MPTSGTHITIVQRLAISSTDFKALLGDPNLDNTTPEGLKARFANLGAVGPDIFYAMADYGADLQDLENFLMKVDGTLQCLGELMGKIDRYVSGVESVITLGITKSLQQSFNLINGIIREGEMALIVDAGVNLWPVFEPAREKDLPREKWYWADYLHYIRSGRFARKLLEKSKQHLDADPGNKQYQNLYAYALGYLTHYVTDVVGHPYVNQVVQAPWRLYWQRHHLVENFIDAYVWDRWHTPNPEPQPPSTEEQPLDTVTTTPNAMGTGAPFTFARLNDLINIGAPTLGDAVDGLVETICQKINQGLFDIGVAEKMDAPTPNTPDFTAWTKMMHDALQEVYQDDRHPKNLASTLSGLGNPRPGGFPLPEDIAAAYNTMRLVLKIGTEEKIKEPQAPNIVQDISKVIQQMANDINKDLGSIPPVPTFNTSGSFSLDALADAVKKAVQWLGDVAVAVGKAAFDFLTGIVSVGGVIVSDSIKYPLYLLNKALFALYRQFRDALVLAAYSIPFTEELAINTGDLDTSTLWRSLGNPASAVPPYQYPIEEIALLPRFQPGNNQTAFTGSTYHPHVPPSRVTGATVEQPPVQWVAPYQAQVAGEFTTPTTPNDFIDAPLGPDDMFSPTGPRTKVSTSDQLAPNSFADGPRNFGGAIANCKLALLHWSDPGFVLPDYNLDGDRGYAWPCWDVAHPAPPPPPPGVPPDQNFEHISPLPGQVFATINPAHVDAVLPPDES